MPVFAGLATSTGPLPSGKMRVPEPFRAQVSSLQPQSLETSRSGRDHAGLNRQR
jgi:hypothetical protein